MPGFREIVVKKKKKPDCLQGAYNGRQEMARAVVMSAKQKISRADGCGARD